MSKIIIHQDKVQNYQEIIDLCPFKAIDYINGYLSINSACKMCRLCIKKDPNGVFEYVESIRPEIDKSQWKGIAVYADHLEGNIYPVTFELIGKAEELAAKTDQPVYCVIMGHNIVKAAEELTQYGVNEVFVYDYEELKHFRIEPYSAAFEDFINHVKPSSILVGGTTIGRSLAPRVASRFRTGLTADCTCLDIQPDTNLDQIRPAFGGNIMAHINTPNHRPQFATVRYKIFNAPEKKSTPSGKITYCTIDPDKLHSNIKVLAIKPKEIEKSIEDAEIIVVAGRAVKKEDDMKMIIELANLLNAQVAGTRSLIETGWLDPKKQIGLSGRTVKPKLIITCGVSGAIQFVAGMNGAEHIVAINTDKNAPIFKNSHIGIIGDIYQIIPQLIEKIKSEMELQ